MEALVRTAPTTYLITVEASKLRTIGGFNGSRSSSLIVANVCGSAWPFSAQKMSSRFRKSVIVEAKKKNEKNYQKIDTHSFVSKPDEATGPFPEAVLLKEKKMQEDGGFLPEFADAEEQQLYEFLNLQMESDLTDQRMRHYEVIYLIHEKYAEEVGKVSEKVEEFLRENKGRIWRQEDWGLRRLAYKIQKAKNAHYMLMNFELEAKLINDFKNMLDKDERVIRHLVIKRDEAITQVCPPPPEFHKMRAGIDGDDDGDDDEDWDDDDGDDDDEDWDDDDGVILVGDDDDKVDETNTKLTTGNAKRKNLTAEKVTTR